jgi:hypothetical protein
MQTARQVSADAVYFVTKESFTGEKAAKPKFEL